MSCKGIGEQFGELADSIDGISSQISDAIDNTADTIANELGIAKAQAKFIALQGEVEAAFQKEFGDLKSALKQLKEGIPLSEEIGDLINLGVQTVDFVNKAKELKEKYGEGNIADDFLRDPAGTLRDFGGDIEKLCESMPNYEKAKDGSIKVTAAKFSLDGGEIDLEEILSEGFSPTFERFKDSLKNIRLSVEPKESTVDKDLASPY
tara:strand:- start:115 stop:735 length:621 start_codon:yes stop_codon:yes gene_type:complete